MFFSPFKKIRGSHKWTKVPDKYAIRCTRIIKRPKEMIIKFAFATRPFSDDKKQEFYAWENVDLVVEEHDLENLTGVILVTCDDWGYVGAYLKKRAAIEPHYYVGPAIFRQSTRKKSVIETIHFSALNQKSDSDAPEWLKEIAIQRNANVAYIELN